MLAGNAAPKGANGGAWADGRLEPDAIPAELLADRPSGELWSRSGLPPMGQWAFNRPTETAVGWLVTCPSCVQGWCRLLPDPGDPTEYTLDLANRCSRGCSAGEIARWHLIRSGELLPREPVEADVAAVAYVRKAVVNGARRVVAAADPVARLARETRVLAELAADRGVNLRPVAQGLAIVARRAGIPAEQAQQIIALHMAAATAGTGKARP
jgi:hypothetical protein